MGQKISNIISSVKETVYYKNTNEKNYKYDESFIDEELVNYRDLILELYRIIYQNDRYNNCNLTRYVEILIIGLIRVFQIIQKVASNEDQEVNRVISIIKNLEILNNKYFSRNENLDLINKVKDTLKLEGSPNKWKDVKNNTFYEIEKQIRDTIKNIEIIEPDSIDLNLVDFEPNIKDIGLSIYEISKIISKMLITLKEITIKKCEEDQKYYKKNPIKSCLKSAEYRKWNYDKFMEGDVTSAKTLVDTKMNDLVVARNLFKTIIETNLQNSFTNPRNIQRKNHLQSQAIVNLRYLYPNYRIAQANQGNQN
jgi:hypothetical protein